jgi:hypothetical protein
MGDRPIARPVPVPDITIEKTWTYIRASNGIGTHDPSVKAVQDIRALDHAAMEQGYFTIVFKI